MDIWYLTFVVIIAAKNPDKRKRRVNKCREKGTKILKDLNKISATGNKAIKIRAI